MRCEESAGFLMLRHCENTAEFRCSYCGKALCSQHAVPLAPQATPGPVLSTPQAGVPAATPTDQEAAALQQAFTTPGAQPAAPTPPVAAQPGAPPAPVAGQPVACPTCLRQQAQQQQQQQWDGYYGGYYYHYPYYGSYRPHYWDYDDRDRGVFDRHADARADAADAQAS